MQCFFVLEASLRLEMEGGNPIPQMKGLFLQLRHFQLIIPTPNLSDSLLDMKVSLECFLLIDKLMIRRHLIHLRNFGLNFLFASGYLGI